MHRVSGSTLQSGRRLDGKPDLTVASLDTKVCVLLNQGDGTFAATVNYATGAGSTSVAPADLNGDGKPNLAVANRGSNNVSLLFNQGNGAFVATVSYGAGTTPRAVVAADLNGDGKPHLAIANPVSSNVSVLLNQGNGTFAPAISCGAGLGPLSIAAADMNADGRLDLAIANLDPLGDGDGVSVLLSVCLP
jgi:hypothetical protein